jgi:segregation and condensation protein A
MSEPEKVDPNIALGAPGASPGAASLEAGLETGRAATTYHVVLPTFEGPLDLLLHLVQEHQLDILDIPIAFLAKRYVEYIFLMEELNIDVASEYLVMAATLAHIKSKMLLPTPPAGQDEEMGDDLDPRAELVRRLLEYQKYKHAAEALGGHPVLGRDVFGRGVAAPEADGPAPFAKYSVFKLFDAFQKLLSRVEQTADHTIDVDRISISERILQLTDRLKGLGAVAFETLFESDSTRADLIVTFLALLEMARLRMMRVHQEAPLEPIFVELTLSDEQELVLAQTDSGDPLASLARDDVTNSVAVADAAAQDD